MRHLLLAVTGILLVGPAHAGTPSAGQWQATFNTEMNIPGMQLPPQSHSVKYCLTPEQAKDVKKATGMDNIAAQGCTVTKLEQGANNVKAVVSCNQNGTQTTTHVNTDYTDTSFTGKAVTDAQMNGMATHIVMNFNGKRIGECGKK